MCGHFLCRVSAIGEVEVKCKSCGRLVLMTNGQIRIVSDVPPRRYAS